METEKRFLKCCTILILATFVVSNIYCQELPKLKSGKNLREILLEKSNYRGSSGYSILEFRINESGMVDSTIVTSRYFARDTFSLHTDKRDHAELKSLKFEPQTKSVWVQCKVYKYLYNSRVWDIDNPTKLDAMRMFDYGLEELWKNEVKTFFTDYNGEFKEFIILNDRIIVAPVYVYGIT